MSLLSEGRPWSRSLGSRAQIHQGQSEEEELADIALVSPAQAARFSPQPPTGSSEVVIQPITRSRPAQVARFGLGRLQSFQTVSYQEQATLQRHSHYTTQWPATVSLRRALGNSASAYDHCHSNKILQFDVNFDRCHVSVSFQAVSIGRRCPRPLG